MAGFGIFMTALLRSLWNYRFFVASSVAVDLRARFVRSRLGALWLVLQPLAQAAIFALILSSVLSARLPGIEGRFAYPTYLLSGMLAWSLFSHVQGRVDL